MQNYKCHLKGGQIYEAILRVLYINKTLPAATGDLVSAGELKLPPAVFTSHNLRVLLVLGQLMSPGQRYLCVNVSLCITLPERCLKLFLLLHHKKIK